MNIRTITPLCLTLLLGVVSAAAANNPFKSIQDNLEKAVNPPPTTPPQSPQEPAPATTPRKSLPPAQTLATPPAAANFNETKNLPLGYWKRIQSTGDGRNRSPEYILVTRKSIILDKNIYSHDFQREDPKAPAGMALFGIYLKQSAPDDAQLRDPSSARITVKFDGSTNAALFRNFFSAPVWATGFTRISKDQWESDYNASFQNVWTKYKERVATDDQPSKAELAFGQLLASIQGVWLLSIEQDIANDDLAEFKRKSGGREIYYKPLRMNPKKQALEAFMRQDRYIIFDKDRLLFARESEWFNSIAEPENQDLGAVLIRTASNGPVNRNSKPMRVTVSPKGRHILVELVESREDGRPSPLGVFSRSSKAELESALKQDFPDLWARIDKVINM